VSDLPQGKLGRLARIAALGMKTGAGMLVSRDPARAADEAARVLGRLRGLAAKVGQMGSYVDGLVPEAQRDAYEASLRVLRAQGPRSSTAEIRASVERELGAPIDRLFAEWNDEPVASASIGQVHRAMLLDGTVVAVKVQHPGIREAVENDLSNASMLEALVGSLGGRRFDSKTLFEVVRARFREELDYRLEAERLAAFAELHHGDETIRVPALFRAHSSAAVLTTAFVEGASFEDAVVASEPERAAFARTLWRFVFKGNLVANMFNADPHPGNYVFHDGGRVTFLDYGCVQVIPERDRPYARALHRAAMQKDEATFRATVSKMIDAKPGALERLGQDFSRSCFEPVFGSPFRITRVWAASLVGEFKRMTAAALKTPDDEFFTMPPEMLFMNRLQFGFYSVLARFDVEVDYASVERAFLPPESRA
jgi:predicted unusual protein kinase regulating ubiquinone biosynthesis (AarF/ABC1/UbiB family)